MLANWVKESTATVGAGAIALGGAPAGFIPFSAAFPDGGPVYYAIEDGNNREVGLGVLASGSPWTLARTQPMETLSGGVFDNTTPAALNLSGAAMVMTSASTAALQIGDRPMVASTNKLLCGNNVKASGASTLVANALSLYPVLIGEAVTIDAIGTNLSVAAAGSLTRLGIYDCDADGWPRKLLASVAIDSTTTGDKLASIPPLAIKPGWYWFGSVTSDAAVKSTKGVSYSAIAASPVGLYGMSVGTPFPYSVSLGAGWSELPALSPGPLAYGYFTAMMVAVRVIK